MLPTLDAPNGGQIQPPESVILPLPESALSFSSPPSSPGTTTTAATTGSSRGASVLPKCQSKRKVRISLPRYRHARIVSVEVLVDGKRVRTLHGRSLRSVLVSFKGRPAGPVTVRLRLRVRRGKHVKTHTLTRRYHLCVAGRGHAK